MRATDVGSRRPVEAPRAATVERRVVAGSSFERTSRRVFFEDTKGVGTSVVDARRAADLHTRLVKLARVLGKDFDLSLAPGERWAYDFDANRITYPATELLGRDELAVMGLICHELSHRRYTAPIDRDALSNPAFHYLWNAVEDIRINKMVSERYAGVPRMMAALYRDFTDIDARRANYEAGAARGYVRTRAEQFGQAAIYAWASGGQRDPLIEDDAVHAALDAAEPFLEAATRLPPDVNLRFDDLSDAEIRREAAASFRVVRDRLWPIYKELLDADVDDLAESSDASDPADGADGADESDGAEEAEASDGAGGAGDSDGAEEAEASDGAGGAGGSEGSEEAAASDGAGGAGGSDGAEEAEPSDAAGVGGGAESRDDASSAKGDGASSEAAAERNASDGGGGAEGVDEAPEGAQDGSGIDPASGEAKDDGSDTIDPASVPEDPLAAEAGDDARREAAKRALEQQLRDRAADLDPKLVEKDEPPMAPRSHISKDAPDSASEPSEVSNPILDYEGDVDVDLEALLEKRLEALRAPEAGADLTTYAGMRTKWARTIDLLVDELSDHLLREQLPPLVGHFKRGVFDLRRSIQVDNKRRATGKADPKVFRRRTEPEQISTRVVFCIDRSGSMHGAKMQSAREAFVVFTEALERLNLPSAALAYDDSVDILREFEDEPTDPEKHGMLAKLGAGGNNNDTAALSAALELLQREGSAECIVFFLTDGCAVENHAAFVREVEERDGVRVIGIGIGRDSADVETTYRHHVRVPDPTQLPVAMGELLREILF